MNLSGIKYVYLLGIGGIGMSALARYFYAMGKNVSGYDKTPTGLTDSMISDGIAIHFEEDIDFFIQKTQDDKSHTLVIYTPAIPQNHSEFIFFKKNGYLLKKRSEVLGQISKESFSIAVAGTHGKTTTTALITHILKNAGIDCTAFVGGIMTNYNTNILIGAGSHSDFTNEKGSFEKTAKKKVMVLEADEYDRSFLTLHPDIAVITSMDADHLDIYGEKKNLVDSFNLFALQVKEKGVLVHRKNLPVKKIKRETLEYSSNEKSDYYAENIYVKNGNFFFEVHCPDLWLKGEVELSVPGRHNIENVLAAISVTSRMGISGQTIKNSIESFRGVKRRFEYIIKTDKLVFVDDYAHHPVELRACINAAKELYPQKRITGVFQPHLYSRTKDFADEFAQSLDLLDEVILLDIYPARELPIAGVDSQMLLNKITCKNKIICPKNELVACIIKKNPEVLITLGAGDIDTLVSPLSLALREEYAIEKSN